MLHEALMNDRFELAYQPIVAVAGGEEAQYQTLLRLRDADGNMHTAAEILPAAEAAGMLHEIDRHVLELAIAILDQRVGENRPVRLFVSQRSEEHTSELQSLMRTSYAVSCLKKKKS